MDVWVYARTSGDESETGQDVAAQVVQVANQCRERGWTVAGQSVDDGMTGNSDPLTRPGFETAKNAVLGGVAAGIIVAEISRFSRQHPLTACLAWEQCTASGVRIVSLKESHFNGFAPDAGDKETVLLRFITFWTSWGERVTIKERTALVMKEIASGRRKTKSGKPPGRPCKISREDAVAARERAKETSPAEAARWLSSLRGAGKALDDKTIKKRRVARTSLVSAWARYGITDENPKGTKKVFVKGGGESKSNGSVCDTCDWCGRDGHMADDQCPNNRPDNGGGVEGA